MDVSGPLLLLETDGVPGAILSPINPHRLTKDQLQQWLRCRGLTVGGTKSELIERFLKRSANKKLCHILDPGFENGKWLELKRQKLLRAANVNVPQKPILPVTGWMSFPSNDIPTMFNEGHIMHYIVESTPAVLPSFIPRSHEEGDEEDDDDEDTDPREGSIEAFRRGKRFVKSKFVLNVKDRSDKNYYYLKGEVRASMKLEIRNVTATLSAGSGAVLDATCTCKARALGRCAHISALLLYANQRVVEYGHGGKYVLVVCFKEMVCL
ncbi:Myocardin-related transcription factor A [Frankliniella fusca]|uniref:Myocardin-related transcription factor A n=1 Tax=Frankliniella fusca TaxID=407009 RepID=A0AAE1HHM7_9NEOP|nr:Myocardin-related transcription factor A [Frankliniella fusca]